MKNASLIALVVAYWALHQDFWNWRSLHPLTFGFLPPGLTYHALYTLGIPLLMWILVRFAWPHSLEHEAESHSTPQAPTGKQ
ncbi:MAG: hypothetical protein HY820_22440 [Acidobacteria bacterium]|nr:hypothetical protein [Acidobacteriota bacterium]